MHMSCSKAHLIRRRGTGRPRCDDRKMAAGVCGGKATYPSCSPHPCDLILVAQIAQFINQFLPEPIGSPLMRVLFTKGMIAADFLGDPTGIRIGHALPNGPTAGSCGPFLFGCNSAQLPVTSTA